MTDVRPEGKQRIALHTARAIASRVPTAAHPAGEVAETIAPQLTSTEESVTEKGTRKLAPFNPPTHNAPLSSSR